MNKSKEQFLHNINKAKRQRINKKIIYTTKLKNNSNGN